MFLKRLPPRVGLSIIRKLVPPKIRRTLKDYFRLYRSKNVRKKLEEKSLRYIEKQRKKGVPAKQIARELGISDRYVRKIWARFRSSGTVLPRSGAGRPCMDTDPVDVEAVLDAYARMPSGVERLALRMRAAGRQISYHAVYRIMKVEGITDGSPARPRQLKWLRYERKYSNAMWHVDWHEMKDSRLEKLNLVAYLDDSSRCITGFGVFERATSENAVLVLRKAIKEFGTPAQVLSDNGSCFTSARRGTPRGSWTPTLFENELLEHSIVLLNSRPHHPQTNGKLERWFRTLEKELTHFEKVDEFIEFYNEHRTHWSLDIKRAETPRMAFRSREATEAIRKSDPKWMEKDTNEGRN